MKQALSRKNIWENLPRPLKTLAGSILRVLPVPVILGKQFRNNIEFVNKAQWWSHEQFQAFQLKQVQQICTHAFEKSPFYRDQFSSAGLNPSNINDLSDIERLPTINRDTINDHLEHMLTVSAKAANVDYITTGGTGGVPLRFYIGAGRSHIEYPYLISGWQRIGYQLGMPMAVIRGRVISPDSHGLPHEYDPLLRHHYYSNFHMTEENMRDYLEHVRNLGPCYLHIYPSSAANLARYMLRHKMKPMDNIRGILAESENVYPEQRQLVEETFGCRYFSSYGHTEKLVAAAECEKSTNYHVWPTYGYFELLDTNGNPVTTPGERGEIVGTGFINQVVPFIRYRTGDYATYIGNKCEQCGREMPIIADIRGHNIQEHLVAKDGSLITWSAVNVHDDTFDHVQQFQFYQDTPGKAVLKIIPASTFCEKDIATMQTNLSRKFDGRLHFIIQVVETISLSKRGKAIFVDQHIQQIENKQI
jgi:phenylacetate-CoA ligase